MDKKQKSNIKFHQQKDNKCFQYPVTVALNYEEIKKDPQRITKIEPFINKYSWGGISVPSKKDDWKKIEKNNVTIALNVLHARKEKMYPPYVSKHNSNCENKVILLIIPNRETWHYLICINFCAVKENCFHVY